jgi:copper homeostasis protein CutC
MAQPINISQIALNMVARIATTGQQKVALVVETIDDILSNYTPYVEIFSDKGISAIDAQTLNDDFGMVSLGSTCVSCGSFNANISRWSAPKAESEKIEAQEVINSVP